jgi:hypothetical protein
VDFLIVLYWQRCNILRVIVSVASARHATLPFIGKWWYNSLRVESWQEVGTVFFVLIILAKVQYNKADCKWCLGKALDITIYRQVVLQLNLSLNRLFKTIFFSSASGVDLSSYRQRRTIIRVIVRWAKSAWHSARQLIYI